MTRKKLTEGAEEAETIVEEQPQHGGSYTRDPATGKLTREEGPEIETHEPAEPELVEPASDAGGGQGAGAGGDEGQEG